MADAATSYQWQRDNGSGWQGIAGATPTTYTTDVVLAGEQGVKFRVNVSNAGGSLNLLLAQDISYWSGVVRRLTPSGMVTTIAGQGTSPAGHDRPAAEATFGHLLSLAADAMEVSTVLGNACEPTTRLGTAPTLRNACGLAIWGPTNCW